MQTNEDNPYATPIATTSSMSPLDVSAAIYKHVALKAAQGDEGYLHFLRTLVTFILKLESLSGLQGLDEQPGDETQP